MNSQKLQKNLLELVLIFSTLVLGTLACSLGGVTIQDGVATIDITLTEAQLNAFISKNPENTNLEMSGDELLKDIDRVETHDGFIRVFGTTIAPTGDDIYGSFDVSFSAEDDILKVKIIDLDMPGLELDDPRIEKINQRLEKELTQSVTESNGEVKYKSASVTEDGLKLTIQTVTGTSK